MKDERSLAWAMELAKALKAWCKTEGIVPSKLAKILGIREGIWYSIISGRSMASDALNYAKVYLWTGLAQADPRKVPPQKLVGVLIGKTKVRAWTEATFNTWLGHPAAKRLLKLKSISGDAPELEESSGLGKQSSNKDDLIQKLVRALKLDVIESLTTEELMLALLASLDKVVRGTPKDRIRWIKEYPEATKLLIILDALLSKDVETILPVVLRQLED